MKLRIIVENGYKDAWSMFDDFRSVPRPKLVKIDPSTVIPYELELYRGFDANIDDIHRRGDKYVLSPQKSEQGLLWFTHKLINGYDPIDYVKGRGKYLLTYKLKCNRHIQRKTFDDGSTFDSIPDETLKLTDNTSNCKYYMGIELPDGWIFSYKMEKFIGCGIDLLVDRDMISVNEE